MKDKMSSYQSSIVKYCEKFQRKILYIKNALQNLQFAISQDPEKIQGTVFFAHDIITVHACMHACMHV
jgi:hypothetical protein